MSEQKQPHLPIGYWLKKADEVITLRINRAQEAKGLSRTGWQVLNLLYEAGSATWEQLAELLLAFATAAELREVINQLAGRGLLEEVTTATCFRLTDEGLNLHRTALESQKEVRHQAMLGVGEAEYATTVAVLQRIVQNLSDPVAAQRQCVMPRKE